MIGTASLAELLALHEGSGEEGSDAANAPPILLPGNHAGETSVLREGQRLRPGGRRKSIA
ncbi:MAG: DUF2783 domain-containing protein [Parvibaculaceae bacterium]